MKRGRALGSNSGSELARSAVAWRESGHDQVLCRGYAVLVRSFSAILTSVSLQNRPRERFWCGS